MNIKTLPQPAAVLLPLLTLLLCLTPPQPALASPLYLSEKKAAKIGRELYDKVTAEIPVIKDQKLTDYVNQIGELLVRHSDRPDGKYTFTVLDSPDINAFASPGGYVYVFRGLLAHMNSEAQLAAVLAHELAHITEDHASKQQQAQLGSNIAAGVVAILTGSGDVGEAAALWGTATVKGYGRDMELEADSVGARYLRRAGYPAEAMLEIITQLKDQQRFSKRQAQDRGKKTPSYHGLFASHPRHDKRLLKIIKDAERSGSGAATRGQDPASAAGFRVATNGLAWGQNSATKPRVENRYYDDQLRFQFDHPETWEFSGVPGQSAAGKSDSGARVTLEIKTRTLDPPREFMTKKLGIGLLRKSEALTVNGLQGHTGRDHTSSREQRVAVLYYGRKAYVFRGEASPGSLDDKLDSGDSRDREIMTIINSFKPRSRRELASESPKSLRYVKAKPGATYQRLAATLKLGRYGADQLRLINGHYPGGEPKAGKWIKIIR